MTQIYSGDKGGNFPELHRVIMNLKGWLRGVHHHVWDVHFNYKITQINQSIIISKPIKKP